jgi:beta-glucosidase
MRNFPFPFLFGAATAAHQVEGDNRANDWWDWESAGRVATPSGRACDHYHRFRQDMEIAEQLGHNAHRLSLEWSRLEPEEGRWDEKAFAHYDRVIQELSRRRIEPVVTLHHFTNPRWFAARGGWSSPEAPACFERFVKRVVEAFGLSVKIWITINEPLVYIYHGYLSGLWPPGEKSTEQARRVFRHFLLAHIRAYGAIHDHYENVLQRPVWVSYAKHMSEYTPHRPDSWRDRWTVWLRHRLFNDSFTDALMSGFLFMPGIFCEFLPRRGALDFIGVNYYTRYRIRFAGWSGEKAVGEEVEPGRPAEEPDKYNSLGWEIYPEGLRRALLRVKKHGLPVLVCENGICTNDDRQREAFIREHLAALARSVREGVWVAGYLHWSLLDNFEWAEGFGPRFGLVEVDYQNFERKIRPSAYVLTEICRQFSRSR